MNFPSYFKLEQFKKNSTDICIWCKLLYSSSKIRLSFLHIMQQSHQDPINLHNWLGCCRLKSFQEICFLHELFKFQREYRKLRYNQYIPIHAQEFTPNHWSKKSEIFTVLYKNHWKNTGFFSWKSAKYHDKKKWITMEWPNIHSLKVKVVNKFLYIMLTNSPFSKKNDQVICWQWIQDNIAREVIFLISFQIISLIASVLNISWKGTLCIKKDL